MRPFFPLLVGALGVASASACSSSDSTSSSSSSSSGSTVTPNASFKNDVMPILAQSCALTACHASKDSNLGIYLTSDPAQVYDELKKDSAAAKLKFVAPSDSKNSWMMIKMDGLQNDFKSKCGSACGTEMPPGTRLAKADRDVVRSWIDQGAKDN